ncbi:hypothetical protein A2U01_0067577, partial [Trifolium medium]|nr:hypothetical protein [Trifolium medium]
KELVLYQPVQLEEFVGEMDTLSKYNSAESVRCFREVVKLYDGGNDEEVVVEPVGEGELVTTVCCLK